MNELPDEVKAMILSQELAGIKQQIYRLSVSAEARKLAGYSAEENQGILMELEKLVKLRDVFEGKIGELSVVK